MAITTEYQAYLKSPKWKSKRLKVLTRAKFRCERCKKKQATQIHHKTYERIFKEELGDLQAVCAQCHMEIHGIENRPKRLHFFGSLGRVLAKVIK
jgi:hypothetical protein